VNMNIWIYPPPRHAIIAFGYGPDGNQPVTIPCMHVF
jgi:hypothetical protein